MITRSCARTFSRSVQSIVTLLRTAAVTSRAIVRNVSSPKIFTALSLVSLLRLVYHRHRCFKLTDRLL